LTWAGAANDNIAVDKIFNKIGDFDMGWCCK
jgi:hypothetical protein